MMPIRAFVVALVVSAVVAGRWPDALAAPAAVDVGELVFSDAVNERGEPIGRKVDFPSGTEAVWASFEYRDYGAGARVSHVVRANGMDFRFGDLACCPGRDGRFAFPIRRDGGQALGGAAYAVFIYDGDREIGRGGFGIQGTGGFEDNENLSNDRGNDNEDD
jgi:hypothetical protein